MRVNDSLDILASCAFLLMVAAFFLESFGIAMWAYFLICSLAILALVLGVRLHRHLNAYGRADVYKIGLRMLGNFWSEFSSLLKLNLAFLISLPIAIEIVLLVWLLQNPQIISDIASLSPTGFLLPALVAAMALVSIYSIRYLVTTVARKAERADRLSSLSNVLCAAGALYTSLTASLLGFALFVLGSLTGALSWLRDSHSTPQEKRSRNFVRTCRRLGTMAFAALLVSVIFVPLSVAPQYEPDAAIMTEHALSGLAHTTKSYKLVSEADDLEFAIWSSVFHRQSGLNVTSYPPDLTFAEEISTLGTIEGMLRTAANERQLARHDISVFFSSSKRIADSSPHSYQIIFSLHQNLSRVWSDNLDLQDAVGRYLLDEAKLLVNPDIDALNGLDQDSSSVLGIIARAKSDYDNSPSSLRTLMDMTLFTQAMHESDRGVRIYHVYAYLIVAINYTRTIEQRLQWAQSFVSSLPANGNVTRAKQLLDRAQLYVSAAENLIERASNESFAPIEQTLGYYKSAIGNSTAAAKLLHAALELVGINQDAPLTSAVSLESASEPSLAVVSLIPGILEQ
jgi:hypothetical protein